MSNKRRPLEPWEMQDAQRLRTLFAARVSMSQDKVGRMSQEKFGQVHGIGTQGAVWQYLHGHIALNLKVALKFARGLGCELADISPTLASQFGKLSEPEIQYKVTKEPEWIGRVPLISWVEARERGEHQEPVPPTEATEWAPVTVTVGPKAFALKVVGDAMEPKIPDDAVVIIDPDRTPQHGDYVLAKRPGDAEATLKQLWYDGATPQLRPLNPRYSVLDMPMETRIIGVVVYIGIEP